MYLFIRKKYIKDRVRMKKIVVLFVKLTIGHPSLLCTVHSALQCRVNKGIRIQCT